MNALRVIAETIKKGSSFLFVSHINPDGDSIGSQLALGKVLEGFGKKVTILNQHPVPDIYNFLYGSGKIKNEISPSESFDIAVVLDASDKNRLGDVVNKALEKVPFIINLDHHVSNNKFGQLQYLNQQASATAVIVYDLIVLLNGKIDKDIAECLYTGILTDTGSFHYLNTDAKSHQVVAEILKYGISPNKIYEEIYEIFNLVSIKLLGLALSSIEMDKTGKIAWMKIRKSDFNLSSLTNGETEGFINYVQMLKGVKVSLFFKELVNDKKQLVTKVSFRSKEDVDVNKIASGFNGGGHAHAAGCVVLGDMDTALDKVIKEVEKYI
ncbi:MAG: bifunctional oligoribonuclease/PAP phosphatase NrnA [bacterium]|nr:bifunctional oligoribonuclease/PAP phosphatase NrnA [bacterium]